MCEPAILDTSELANVTYIKQMPVHSQIYFYD